jgi:hypothetical protein
MQMTKTILSSLAHHRQLRQMIPMVPENLFPKFLGSLIQHVRELGDYASIVRLLFVEFRENLPEITILEEEMETAEENDPQASQKKDNKSGNSDSVYDELLIANALAESMKEWLSYDEARKAEMEVINRKLKEMGMVLANVPSDGNCFYTCLSQALLLRKHVNSPPQSAAEARTAIVHHMRSKPENWFELPDGTSHAGYLGDQAKNGTWGDVNVVQAAADLYRQIIHVYSGEDDIRIFEGRVGLRGPKTQPVLLFLIQYRHYMFACTQKQAARLTN